MTTWDLTIDQLGDTEVIGAANAKMRQVMRKLLCKLFNNHPINLQRILHGTLISIIQHQHWIPLKYLFSLVCIVYIDVKYNQHPHHSYHSTEMIEQLNVLKTDQLLVMNTNNHFCCSTD
jgi:hypothetical protein